MSSSGKVPWRRSPPSALPIANRHGIAAYSTALPIRKKRSSPTPAARPTEAKNRIWNSGVTRNDGTRIHGLSQLNSAR
jgi:hypothetical protein